MTLDAEQRQIEELCEVMLTVATGLEHDMGRSEAASILRDAAEPVIDAALERGMTERLYAREIPSSQEHV